MSAGAVDVLVRCFACGRGIGRHGEGLIVDTRDGQMVAVGTECFTKIIGAGDKGYQPPKGGPRLYPLAAQESRRHV